MRYRKMNGDEVIVYTDEERQKALQVSLTSLASSLGYTPVRQGAHYSLKEMDSLVIYNDRSWNRWSQKGSITGGSQIDFMMAFGGAASVPEAIQKLLEFKGERIAEVSIQDRNSENTKKQDREFVLPEKNGNYRRLYAYLTQTRGISSDVVSDFVHRRLIYEDAAHHNIVYCGYDPDGNIRYAGLRGTADIYGKKFKMDVAGNDKNYGVNIVNPSNNELKVFESVIDCMSYIDMYGDRTSNKLVLGMVEDNPLEQFLKDYDHIDSITFCLDYDEAGKKAIYGEKGKQFGLEKKYLDRGFQVNVEIPPFGKDFNESLISMKEYQKTNKEDHSKMKRAYIVHGDSYTLIRAITDGYIWASYDFSLNEKNVKIVHTLFDGKVMGIPAENSDNMKEIDFDELLVRIKEENPKQEFVVINDKEEQRIFEDNMKNKKMDPLKETVSCSRKVR